MCEIFPEVPNCCFLFKLKIGMLFISIISMITGCITLSIIEQKSNASFDSVKSVADIRNPDQVMSNLGGLINAGVTGMSLLYMFAGLMLLFSTLTDQEGFAQVFVWVTFLGIIIGFGLIIIIAVECMFKATCVLSSLDWLSASATIVAMVFYLILWFYFICVANSYVLNG